MAAPRGELRLLALLRDLGAVTITDDPESRRATKLSLEAIVTRAQASGYGMLLAVLALIAIPFVGLSTPFGLAAALMGSQLMAARPAPWVPGWLRRRQIPLSALDRVLALLEKRAAWLGRVTKPRWTALCHGAPRLAVGLGILITGAGLALPLPIPGSNLVFLIPIFVYAMGLLEEDGAWIALGHLMTLVDIVLLIAFGKLVLMGLGQVGNRLGC